MQQFLVNRRGRSIYFYRSKEGDVEAIDCTSTDHSKGKKPFHSPQRLGHLHSRCTKLVCAAVTSGTTD